MLQENKRRKRIGRKRPTPASPDAELNRRIGERLQELRILFGLGQAEIAEILGVAPQQWQKYEKGQNRISYASVLVLQKCLGVPGKVFEPDGSAEGLSLDSRADYRQRLTLIRHYNTCSAKDRRAVRVMAGNLAGMG